MLKPAQVFSSPDMHASCLLLMAVDSWGMECIDWEPETITTAVRDQFGAELHALNYDKIQAAISLVSSNLYHRSPGAFCAINKSFSFKSVNNKEFNVCTLDDILWGTTEAKLLEGPEQFEEEGFTHDISRYVGQLLQAEGVTTPPSNLKFAEYDDTVMEAKNMSEFQDPTAWKMVMQREEDEISDMNNFMGINLIRLFKQLKVLPLTNNTALQQNIDGMLASIKEKLGKYAESEDYQP
jgi:hypothetical protein